DAVVDEEERAGARGCRPQPLGEREQRAAGQVLLAQLDRWQASGERRLDDADEITPAGRRAVGHEDERRDPGRRHVVVTAPPYCSSLTFSIHSMYLPSSASIVAMWLMAVVGVAPCQCFSPGGHDTTSPGRMTSIGPPQLCTSPHPDVTIRV